MMKILWITNIPLPEASLLMNEKPLPYGGWLINTSKYLLEQGDCELAVAFPKNNIKKNQVFYGERIEYYVFPQIDGNKEFSIDNNAFLKNIIDKVKPNLVHIFGTEFEHSLAIINVCNEYGIESVISIQGLVSIISKHYMANLPFNIQKRFTLRDFAKQDNIQQQQKNFIRRGKIETEAIKRAKNVIGRTTWDKACVSQMNPDAMYYFCNETLRDEFYNNRWNIEDCEEFSIFTSQASYPIKGIHFVLEAMLLVIKKYPNSKLYIAGHNIIDSMTFIQKIKLSSYAIYIKDLIKKYNLVDNVVFTGILDEKQMCERYLKSHVFVCPSTIENSPNSLGEAMILGVPCVASYVGGIPDMLKDKIEGFLYQYDAPYILAYYICEIFKNGNLALNFSNNARVKALITHDRDLNTRRLIEIYKKILEIT